MKQMKFIPAGERIQRGLWIQRLLQIRKVRAEFGAEEGWTSEQVAIDSLLALGIETLLKQKRRAARSRQHQEVA